MVIVVAVAGVVRLAGLGEGVNDVGKGRHDGLW